MNLYTQFSKAANLYFLLIAYMQTIKSISISGGKSVMALPLSVIVIISMIKDAYEDYQRHCSDGEENNKQTLVYDEVKKDWVSKAWKEILPGQLVKVLDEEFIPADLIVLKSVDSKGGLYIETKNLDGETNLKNKNVAKDVNSMHTEENVTAI